MSNHVDIVSPSSTMSTSDSSTPMSLIKQSPTSDTPVKPHVVSADGKTFTCGDCGKVFNAHYNLTRHMPVHTGARPFICKVCCCVGTVRVELSVCRYVERDFVKRAHCVVTKSFTQLINHTNVVNVARRSIEVQHLIHI